MLSRHPFGAASCVLVTTALLAIAAVISTAGCESGRALGGMPDPDASAEATPPSSDPPPVDCSSKVPAGSCGDCVRRRCQDEIYVEESCCACGANSGGSSGAGLGAASECMACEQGREVDGGQRSAAECAKAECYVPQPGGDDDGGAPCP